MLSKIESILFVASKPLKAKQIAKALNLEIADVEAILNNIKDKFNRSDSGIHILSEEGYYRMAINPSSSEAVESFIKDEAAGDLTRAQLETLTLIAYRSPISRPELEQIRGVNCAIIIRNLLIRGLIIEDDDKEKVVPVYSLSLEALRHLAVNKSDELPDYDRLRNHEFFEKIVNQE